MTATKTNARTATATDNVNLAPYSIWLKAWQVKASGAKPTAENFAFAHALGCKPGSKTAMAVAMYHRPDGASQPQVVSVVGGPYLNKMREAVQAGHAARVPVPSNALGHTVYKLALPSKAARKPKAATKAAGKAKPTKAAGKAATRAELNKAATELIKAADMPQGTQGN